MDHIGAMSLEELRKVGPTTLMQHCPDCLRDLQARPGGASGIRVPDLSDFAVPSPIHDFRPRDPIGIRVPDLSRPIVAPPPPLFDAARLQAKLREQAEKAMMEEVGRKLQQASNTLFAILAVVSVVAFAYSIASRLGIGRHLPSFPYFPYTIAYALFVALVVLVPAALLGTVPDSRINWSGFLQALMREHLIKPISWLFATFITLASPRFRGVLFSQMGGGIQNLLIPAVFLLASVVSLSVLTRPSARLFRVVAQEFAQKGADYDGVKALRATLSGLGGLALFFGLLSPYLLGVVRPAEVALPKAYALEQSYQEHITDEDVSRQQASRQHFVDGKRLAALGTRRGFVESIKHYEQASLLVPAFGTSQAERAFAHASIARIDSEANGRPVGEQDDYRLAVELLRSAESLYGTNPNFPAVSSILSHYAGNQKAAAASLAQARQVAEKAGVTDRVLQAMALVDPTPTARLGYLLSLRDNLPGRVSDPDLKDIFANSAEVHSLLGLTYWQIGRYDLARPVLERAVRLNPDYAEAYLNLGLVDNPSERTAHYAMATRDPAFKVAAERYSVLATAQRWLRIFYLVLLAYLFIGLFRVSSREINAGRAQISAEGISRGRRHVVRCLLTFAVTYALFELAVHAWGPPVSVMHAFPLMAPFF